MSKRLKKILSGFIASTLVVIVILVFGSTQNEIVGTTRNSAEALENIFYDLFFKGKSFVDDHDIGLSDKITIAEGYDPSILIVDIDEPSLEKLGPFNEWDRDVHANVVNNLSQVKMAAIPIKPMMHKTTSIMFSLNCFFLQSFILNLIKVFNKFLSRFHYSIIIT